MMQENITAIFEGLDSSQAEAVRQSEGPVLIVAGAGSGKTRVLTSRIAYLLAKGTEPDRVLALTFTKKAAGEMKDRIAAMVGERKARRLYMGTFHSVFIRFLRDYSDRLGYPQAFTIYDQSDSTSAIKRVIKDMGLDDKVYKPKEVLGRISMAKNNLVTVARYVNTPEIQRNDAAAKKPRLGEVYSAYQDLLKKSGVMDFDDILVNMNILLEYFPDACAEISARFDHILVDEYQDTNYAQYRILNKLAQVHHNLCVVGDDSQSIYAFRGAKIENILNFRRDYPESKTFYLERNYRSTKNIVNAANAVIARNKGRIKKTCFSDGDAGEKIRLVQAYTENEEALLVASSIISRMQSDHAGYQDFAILYRTNSQSRALEEALRKRNLPYMIYSGNSFFDRAEVKDMMAYLKLAVNTADDESFRRIVNKPARGIGETSVEALSAAAAAAGCSLMQAVSLEGLDRFGLRNAAVEKLRSFAAIILEVNSKLAETDAYKAAAFLSDASGLYRSFKEDMSIESQSRASNIEELVNSVKTFVESRHNDYVEDLMVEGTIQDGEEISESDLPVVTLGEFLEDISLLSAVDVSDEESSNKIALMTVHSAKGLEFPYVYVTGLEENLFPSGGMLASPSDIEEERRLFYVAVTRAQKAVELTFATTRMRNGKHESNPPSRFLRELDPDCLVNPLQNEESFGPTFGQSSTYSFRPQFQQRPGSSSYGSRSAVSFGRGQASSSSRPDGSSFGDRSGVSFGSGQASSSSRPGASSFGSRPSSSRPDAYSPGSRPTPGGRPSSPSPRPVFNRPAPAPAASDAEFIPVSVYELREGQRIEHNRFGFGVIRTISGTASDLKATIDFDTYGTKILLLKYAKIRLA
ncbi:MAG: UvrD-helicase domain-containing protein [Bacteroidales bacterium]|nr:UvrD-helicase domain-containing protein [Bacteroidales bacterium]